MHRTSTLKWISLWISLLPWINEGIVGFVRAPGDFYPQLALKSYKTTQARFDRHPDLRALMKEELAAYKSTERYDSYLEQITLTMPDGQLRALAREQNQTPEEIEEFLAYVQRRREEHPTFLGPENPNEGYHEPHQMSTGTNYEQAKLIALHSNSYVMTDLRVRWREIEVDRADSGIDAGAWSPFAKAFDGVPFKFLDAVPLDAALAIRREGRLDSMRSFMRKVWDATSKVSPFDDANIPSLAAELAEKIREAESEWRKIDRDLIKVVATQVVGGLLATGPLVASGNAAWLGAAATVAGVADLVQSTMRRREYKLEYPAGFFVDLQKGKYGQ